MYRRAIVDVPLGGPPKQATPSITSRRRRKGPFSLRFGTRLFLTVSIVATLVMLLLRRFVHFPTKEAAASNKEPEKQRMIRTQVVRVSNPVLEVKPIPAEKVVSNPIKEKKPIWSNYTINEIYRYLDCDEVFDRGDRPIHSQETWMLLRETYQNIVGEKHSSIAPLTAKENGFPVKVKAAKAPGKGRGVFAAEFIPEGSVVWTMRQTARFTTGESVRKFLMSIPRDIACDTTKWAYAQTIMLKGNKKKFIFNIDLDEGCLMNNDASKSTIGCAEGGKAIGAGCKNEYVALRDIQAGEELTLDYGGLVFGDEEGWEELGLY